jgi:hypothetical protein
MRSNAVERHLGALHSASSFRLVVVTYGCAAARRGHAAPVGCDRTAAHRIS